MRCVSCIFWRDNIFFTSKLVEQLNINQSPITKIKSAGSSPEMLPYQPAMALTLRTTDSIPRALPPVHHQIEAVETNEQEKARGRRDKNPQATAPNKKKIRWFCWLAGPNQHSDKKVQAPHIVSSKTNNGKTRSSTGPDTSVQRCRPSSSPSSDHAPSAASYLPNRSQKEKK